MIVLAGVLIGLATFLFVPQSSRRRLLPQKLQANKQLKVFSNPRLRNILCSTVTGLLLVFAVFGHRVFWWVSLGVIVAGTGYKLVADGRFKVAKNKAAEAVARACTIISSQLKIGQVPLAALRQAAAECPVLLSALATAEIGGDVGDALEKSGQLPGQEGLTSLSRAWRLCERTGSPLSLAAEQVAETLRDDRANQALINAELAGARATGKLMACLPAVGLLLGFSAGGDPITFFFTTVFGQFCIVSAVVLACLGLLWSQQLAKLGNYK